MANIPGIAGYTQPGVFARDRVISRGVSIPGGIRIVCIMGEGLREETLVSSAAGGGRDGRASVSPTGSGDGKFFKLASAPVVSGRTEIYLNGSPLYGVESGVDASGFDGKYDFRVDTSSGLIELQGASISDQDGDSYSAVSTNTGSGSIYDGTCGTMNLIDVVDSNAPEERWTVRCVGVSRDSNGDPIPGKATFTLSGAVSGQVRDSGGSSILFHSDSFTSDSGAISANSDVCSNGLTVASSLDFAVGDGVAKSGDASPTTTDQFQFAGNLAGQGQVLAGDYLCVDGYTSVEISDLESALNLDGVTYTTTLYLATDTVFVDDAVAWEIRASNVFIDDETVAHDGVTGDPLTDGPFSGSDIGKVLTVCSGDSTGRYIVEAVTSSRRVRLSGWDEEPLPTLIDDDEDGVAESNLTYYMLESNGVVSLGVVEGTVPFEVGDKFFVDVSSKVLKRGDLLEARYIYEGDVNDPEYFTSANSLMRKHGTPSTTNTISLGAQMAFENGAPAVLAIQCMPPLPRRISSTLIPEVDSNGDGGFSGCLSSGVLNCDIDDLILPIKRPFSGLVTARPDGDTQVNLFVVRGGAETQIFPNKVAFYNSQFESETGHYLFTTSSDTSYSYTIVNTDTQVVGQGHSGEINPDDGLFSSLEIDFDNSHAENGSVIVVQSLEYSDGTSETLLTDSSDIGMFLFGDASLGAELAIPSGGVVDDNSVTVLSNEDGVSVPEPAFTAYDIQFYIKNPTDTSNLAAALILHEDLVTSGTLQKGDGIRVSYIDQADSDFYDVNWFNALERLEAADCQMVVPLPTKNRSGIFRAVLNHCENMSTIANQQERIALIGAQQGVTAEALIGIEEIAVEDIGILEGIQGDDPEEVLDGNTEDLVNYKLNENFTSNRCVYFYPDQIVRNVNGTNTYIDGFYMAAAASGRISSTQNVAIPLTYKTLSGFSILRDRVLTKTMLNQLGNVGACILQPVVGGGKILHGRTTSISGFVEDEELSIVFIRDRVKDVLRESLKGFLGRVEDQNTQGLMTARVGSIMSALTSQGLITDYQNIKVERDKVDPRQWNVFLRFQPAYPINYIFVDIEVGVL
jgi:hypothetical protein